MGKSPKRSMTSAERGGRAIQTGTPSGTASQRAYFGSAYTPSGTPRTAELNPQAQEQLRQEIIANPQLYGSEKQRQEQYGYLFEKSIEQVIAEKKQAEQKLQKQEQLQGLVPTTILFGKPLTVTEEMKNVSQQNIIQGQYNLGQRTFVKPVYQPSGFEYKTGMYNIGEFIPKVEYEKPSGYSQFVTKHNIPVLGFYEGLKQQTIGEEKYEREKAFLTYTEDIYKTELEAKQIQKEQFMDIEQFKTKYPKYIFAETPEGFSFNLKEEYIPSFSYEPSKWGDYGYTYKEYGGGLKGATIVGGLISYKIGKGFVETAPLGFGAGAVARAGWGVKGLATLGKIEKGAVVFGGGALAYSTYKNPLGTLMKAPEIVGGIAGYGAGRKGAGKFLDILYKPTLKAGSAYVRAHKFGEVDVYYGLAQTKRVDFLKTNNRFLKQVLPSRIEMGYGEPIKIFTRVETKKPSLLEPITIAPEGYKGYRVESDFFWGVKKPISQGYAGTDVFVKGGRLKEFKGMGRGAYLYEGKISQPFYTDYKLYGYEFLRMPRAGGKIVGTETEIISYGKKGILDKYFKMPLIKGKSFAFIPKEKRYIGEYKEIIKDIGGYKMITQQKIRTPKFKETGIKAITKAQINQMLNIPSMKETGLIKPLPKGGVIIPISGMDFTSLKSQQYTDKQINKLLGGEVPLTKEEIRIRQITKQQLKQRERERQREGQLPVLSIVEILGEKEVPLFGDITAQIQQQQQQQKQILKQKQVTLQKGYTALTPSGGFGDFGFFVPPPPFVPFIPPFVNPFKEKPYITRPTQKKGRKYQYSPSLGSILLGITTKRVPSRKVWSGLELRPAFKKIKYPFAKNEIPNLRNLDKMFKAKSYGKKRKYKTKRKRS